MRNTELIERILTPYKTILDNMDAVYIFGMGVTGKKVYAVLQKRGIAIKGFIDNNKPECYALSQITDKNAIIIIAGVTYLFEIEQSLKAAGFSNIVPIPIFALAFNELTDFNQSYNGLIDDYITNQKEYKKLYGLFDNESIQVLNTLIEYRKTYKTDLFSKITRNVNTPQYFEDFLSRKFTVFVDGGGFDGDSVQGFIQFNKEYEKIYFFEPDTISMDKAKENLKQCKNIEFLPFGLAEKESSFRFSTLGNLASSFNYEGDKEIKCVSLDNIIKEDKAFIKLDIEGFEIAAINGAKRLIRNNSLLAVCVYHNPSDIWKIPNLILSINPNYTFFLRHYSDCILETVLYGVPLND